MSEVPSPKPPVADVERPQGLNEMDTPRFAFELPDPASDPGTRIEAVRLVDGVTDRQGRVEVRVLGRWGTICNDNFDNNDAAVICRMLGFRDEGGVAMHTSLYRDGFGITWMDELACVGTELSLNDCPHAGYGREDCGHIEDAAVSCEPASPARNLTVEGSVIQAIKLVGGRDATEGRLAIQISGVWGTVCDDGFDRNAITVACRMLGYRFGVWMRTYLYATLPGPIYFGTLSCVGNETALDLCPHRGIEATRCTHSEDIAIHCT